MSPSRVPWDPLGSQGIPEDPEDLGSYDINYAYTHGTLKGFCTTPGPTFSKAVWIFVVLRGLGGPTGVTNRRGMIKYPSGLILVNVRSTHEG